MNNTRAKHSTRNNSIDIARGIAILGVLYGHVLAWQGANGYWLSGWFWSFHMALFAIVAGYFHKERKFFDTLWNSIRTLFIPYMVVSLVLLFVNHMHGWNGGWSEFGKDVALAFWNFVTLKSDPPGFWFVIAIFNCRILLAVVDNVLSLLHFAWAYTKDVAYIALTIIGLVLVFCVEPIDICQITHTFALLPFIILGYYAHKFSLLNRQLNMYWAIVIVIVLVSAGWLGMDIWGYKFPLGLFNYLTASAISFAVLFACRYIDTIHVWLIRWINQVVAYCGQHSLRVLAFQAILGYKFIHYAQKFAGIQNAYVIMVLFIVACVAMTYALTTMMMVIKERIIKTKNIE